MKRLSAFVVYGLPMFLLGALLQFSTPQVQSHNLAELQQAMPAPVTKVEDIGIYEWVDKSCRMWAADGDIDVDQTCLSVRTVRGGWVVIPNHLNDAWTAEITSAVVKEKRDKWVSRFFDVRRSTRRLP
jgi:hypothetical protein